MKNIFRHKHILTAFFVFASFIITFSCNNITEVSDTPEESVKSKTCIVKFNVSEEESRAIKPQVYKLTDLAYSLDGTLDDNNKISGNWENYEDMKKASFTMQAGKWTFTMYAYVKETKDGKVTVAKEPMLESEISQTIKEGSNQLAFTMKTCDEGLGSFSMDLTFNKTITKVVASLCKLDGTIVEEDDLKPKKDEEQKTDVYDPITCGAITQTWEGDSLSSGRVTYEIKNIVKGYYKLAFTLTEGSGEDAKESYLTQLATVVPGTSSSGTYDISDESPSAEKYYAVYYYDGVEDEDIQVPEDKNLYKMGNTINIKFPTDEDAQLLQRDGWIFTGWKNTNTGAIFSKEGTAKLSIDENESEKISLVAMWVREGNQAVVFFHGNGGKAVLYEGGEEVEVYEQQGEKTTDTYVAPMLNLTPNRFKRAGYLFVGWAYNEEGSGDIVNDNTQLSLRTDDTHLYAVWQPQYVVKYMLQDTEGDGYTEDESKRETKCGKAGDTVDVTKNTDLYPGFSLVDFDLPKIEADGSTVVEIKYNRKVHTVSYSAGTGVENVTLPDSKSYRYGATVTFDTEPERQGYTFGGWTYNKTILSVGDSIPMPDEDITLTASWDDKDGIPYKVEHYLQKLNAGETFLASDYVLDATVDRAGKTNALTTAAAISSLANDKYKGFTQGFTEGKVAGTIEQQAIKADGSTVIKIYYNRNYYTVSYVENLPEKLKTDTEKGEITIPSFAQYRHEAIVPYAGATIPENDGYEFLGWSSSQSATAPDYTENGENKLKIGTSDVTLYAVWKAKQIEYTVKYWKQNLEAGETFNANDYTEDTVSRETVKAEVWTTTDVSIEESKFTGFKWTKTANVTINPRETNVVNVYYDRRTASVVYNANGGLSKPESKVHRYGASVTVDFSNTARTGYIFKGWANSASANEPLYTSNGTDSFTMGTENVYLYAVWDESTNTPYIVQHYYENVSKDGYVLEANYTEKKTGTTNSQTVAVARTDPGFGAGFTEGKNAGIVEQQTINAAGDTVVKIYYNRITYRVTYEDGVNDETITVPDSKDYPYDATVNFDTIPIRTGYTFLGWQKGETLYRIAETKSIPMPAESITLVAKWDANTGTAYTVMHYLQKLSAGDTFNADDYDIVESDTETRHGETAKKTEAIAKSSENAIYKGFKARPIEQQTIKADGSTVINIYYDRNKHTVSYDFNGIGTGEGELTPIAAQTYRYGATATVEFPEELSEFAGYDFYGWSETAQIVSVDIEESVARYKKNEGFTMGDADVILYAVWKPRSDVKYTVKHMGQELDRTTNEPKKDDQGNFIYVVIADPTKQEGITGKVTEAAPIEITGFTKETVEKKPISRTGDTVVEYKYTRNSYNFTYDLNMPEAMVKDGNKGTITAPSTGSYYYESNITYPSITYSQPGDVGYTFEGWTTSKDATEAQYQAGATNIKVSESLVKGKTSGSEIKFYAIWKPIETVQYTVEHYLQNTDDDEYTVYQTDEKDNGVAWTTTSADAIDIPGATLVAEETKNIVLNPHNTATENVAKLYYDRVTASLTYDANGGIGASQTAPYRYGKVVDLNFAGVSRKGYDFLGWASASDATEPQYTSDSAKTVTMGTKDITLYAVWTESTYTLEYDLNLPPALAADGNKGTITAPADDSKKYLSEVTYTPATIPDDDGYEFLGWSLASNATTATYKENFTVDANLVPSDDSKTITLYAVWKAQEISYTVKYWQQNLDDDEYTEHEESRDTTQTAEVWTTTAVTAAADKFTGFTPRETDNVINVSINPHAENVVNVYYDRERYLVYYKANDNDEGNNAPGDDTNYRFEAPVTLKFNMSRAGYYFLGWGTSENVDSLKYNKPSDDQTTVSFTIGKDEVPVEKPDQALKTVTLYAIWQTRSDTKYTVRHYQQKLEAKANFDQDDYELVSLDTAELTGKTADNTVAVENSYPGFTEGFTVGNEPGTITQEKIAGNGNTVIRIYYNRKTYTLHYDVNATADWDGTSASVPADSNESYRFGATITPSYEMGGKRTGYSFMGWDTRNDVVTASYKKAPYKKDSGGENPVVIEVDDSIVIDEEIANKADASGVLTLYAVWQANNVSGSSGGIDITTPEYPESGSDKELIQSTVVADDGNTVTFKVKTWNFINCIYTWYVNGENAGSIKCGGESPVISDGCNFSAPSEPGDDGLVTITWDTSNLDADRYDLSLTLTGYDNLEELERHSQQTYINIVK